MDTNQIKIKWDTRPYYTSRLTQPKGRGWWFFEIEDPSCAGYRQFEASGTLSEAKKVVAEKIKVWYQENCPASWLQDKSNRTVYVSIMP
jgi:hypothetical protein